MCWSYLDVPYTDQLELGHVDLGTCTECGASVVRIDRQVIPRWDGGSLFASRFVPGATWSTCVNGHQVFVETKP